MIRSLLLVNEYENMKSDEILRREKKTQMMQSTRSNYFLFHVTRLSSISIRIYIFMCVDVFHFISTFSRYRWSKWKTPEMERSFDDALNTRRKVIKLASAELLHKMNGWEKFTSIESIFDIKKSIVFHRIFIFVCLMTMKLSFHELFTHQVYGKMLRTFIKHFRRKIYRS